MSYLEQSTRYVPYTDRPDGRWKYAVPTELATADQSLHSDFSETLDRAFETYARWIEPMQAHFRALYPKPDADSDGVYRSAIRAKALDALRGLLPAQPGPTSDCTGPGRPTKPYSCGCDPWNSRRLAMCPP